MPSLAIGRFFPRPASSSFLTNISDEIFPVMPMLEEEQFIITSSPTINLIYKIFLPCFIFIGTCGSIMSLKCLYAQRYRNNNSTYIFFFFIALVDLAILHTGALRLFVLALTGRRTTNEMKNFFFFFFSLQILMYVQRRYLFVVCIDFRLIFYYNYHHRY